MKLFITRISLFVLMLLCLTSCSKNKDDAEVKVLFLHHSTGNRIWKGKEPTIIVRAIRRINGEFADKISTKGIVPDLFAEYNTRNHANYSIVEREFPKIKPYGWRNNPYDYYNIWVKNAGEVPYKEEPTLEMLSKEFDVIMFKHCFPVSNIQPDNGVADINSDYSSLANYKLQYNALKEKLKSFPDTKFILWTGATQVQAMNSEESALRAREFFNWVRKDWDQEGDNIHLWDFYGLQTEGGLYFLDKYAVSKFDSHPNDDFSKAISPLLVNRVIDIIENNGNTTSLTGEAK